MMQITWAKLRTRTKRTTFCTYCFLLLCFLLLLIYVVTELMRLPTPPANRIYILDELNDGGDPDQVTENWETQGWTYYASLIDFVKYQPEPTQEPKILGPFRGFWIPSRSPESNFIRLQNFQSEPPLPVSIGIRLYVKGDARLELRYTSIDRPSNSMYPSRILRLFQDKNSTHLDGFCNKIIIDALPSFRNGLPPDLIEIKGILPNDGISFVAIDKVIVTLGIDRTQESLLYTLLPDNWCEKKGVYFSSRPQHVSFIPN